MPYINLIHPDDADGELKKIFDTCIDRAGYVANILQVQSLTPVMLRESLRFYIHLMKSPNALTAARREMVAAVVSSVNDCYY